MSARAFFWATVALGMMVFARTAVAEVMEDGRQRSADAQRLLAVDLEQKIAEGWTATSLGFGPQHEPGVVVLDFEDLPPVGNYGRLPSGYHSLEWDCYYHNDSVWWNWKTTSTDPTYAQSHSGVNYLLNAWGAKTLGFSLPDPTNMLLGAWFAGAAVSSPPPAVRFNGYDSAHQLVQQSAWLALSNGPQYLDAHFSPVARIEVEHSAAGAAWYTMDDLRYALPEPSTLVLLSMGAAGFAICAWLRRPGITRKTRSP